LDTIYTEFYQSPILSMQNLRSIIAFFLLAICISSCQKDSQINGPKNNSPFIKKYYIKSFASSISDSTTYTYNTQMRLIKKVVFAPSNYRVNSIDSTIYLYSYNNKGQLDTITTKIPNGVSYTIGYQTCAYNTEDALSRVNYLTHTFSLYNYFIISYNSKKRVDSTADLNQADSLLGYTLFLYDSIGNCIAFGNKKDGKFVAGSEYKYDNDNSMYSGLPIYNYAQSFTNGLSFGDDYIAPIHNVVTSSYNVPGYNMTFNISYQYNKDGYPVLESFRNNGSGSIISYRITYYEK